MAKSSKRKPALWISCKIPLRSSRGETLLTLTLNCVGEWTYHPTLKDAYHHKFSTDTWSIMHIPTGAIAVFCGSEDDARNCVAFLGQGCSWGEALLHEEAKRDELLTVLKAAREQGKILFFFGSEKREVMLRFQEDQWERELVAALG